MNQPEEVMQSTWEDPTVTFVGTVSDLVQGGGKSGPNADSDPQSTRKTGVG